MEYITETLGLNVAQKPWKYFQEMPYYIQDAFRIDKVTLEKIEALFIYPKIELEHIAALKKQIGRIQKMDPIPVVIVLHTISRYRRDALIAAKIPFVVPGKQLYLPFIGTYMQERFDPEDRKMEKFQPATQVLFFYYLYRNQRELYTSQAVKDLGYSAMTISRATKQLVQTGYFIESKNGVQKVLTGTADRKALFEKMRGALINPIRRRTSVKWIDVTDHFLIAGDSALARKTMLNDNMFRYYAVDGKVQCKELPYAMDANTDVNLELWKYDPKLLSQGEMVDVENVGCRKVISKVGAKIDTEKMEMEYCRDCQRFVHAFDKGAAVFAYDDVMRHSISMFKYHNRREYAKVYAREMYEHCRYFLKMASPEVILPVPIHKQKKRQRGFNQAELVAKELGKLMKVPVDTKYLSRKENTVPQKELTRQQRSPRHSFSALLSV